jgi:hypothetical protein
MSKKDMKRYIIRKYILAESAIDAIKKDNKTPVDEVWVDTDYKTNSTIGFTEKLYEIQRHKNLYEIKRTHGE